MHIPEDLKYAPTHQWVRFDGDRATVGITDFAARELKQIIFLELPSYGDTVRQGEPMGVIESLKALDDVYSPISGTVTDVNTALLDNLDAITDDPYGEGWMVVISPADIGELDELMDAEEYGQHLCEDER